MSVPGLLLRRKCWWWVHCYNILKTPLANHKLMMWRGDKIITY